MHREDDKHRSAEEFAAERAEHEHPAGPQQGSDEGFAEGETRMPHTPDEEAEPNFARGIAHEVPPGTEHHGRFSEGQEELPDSPEKAIERRFSEGIERSPTSE
jgi:hypothetical protein